MLLEVICYSLSGFFMKLSDEGLDKVDDKFFAIITGLLCVLFTVVISHYSSDAACIFLSILVSNVLAFKVDCVNHILSAILLIILFYFIGVPTFSWLALLLCVVAGVIDEWGNDKSDKNEWGVGGFGSFLKVFFRYRCMLKVFVLLLSVLGLLHYLFAWSFIVYFEPLTVVYLCLFDVFYEFAGLVFDRVYDIL